MQYISCRTLLYFYTGIMGLKYKVNECFFDRCSNEMAYVLGYMFADGSLEDAHYLRGKYVRVTSTDLDRITSIKRLLSSEHTIVKRETDDRRKKRYMLRIGSHALFDRLNTLGVTPRKSLTMCFPAVPSRFLPSFTRGYFDGDGCVYIGHSPGGTSRLTTIFTSGSEKFLSSLKDALNSSAKIAQGTLHSHGSTKGTYQLRFFARDSMHLFDFMYPRHLHKDLLLYRKYAIFTRYFDEIRLSASRRMSKYIPAGHVAK